MIFLDTDVMVDVLRGYQPAIDWLAQASEQEIGLPGLVAMELLQGCQNAREQKDLEKLLRNFPLYWAESEDCERALKVFSAYHLSHQVGLLDALIAAAAIGYDADLATFNARHYGVIKDLRTVQPYTR
jgi:hypothetical protein